MIHFTSDQLNQPLEFKETDNRFVKLDEFEQVPYAFLLDALGDQDGLPEEEDVTKLQNLNNLSSGQMTWKYFVKEAEQKLTIDWVSQNASWALENLSPYLNTTEDFNRFQNAPEKIHKAMIMWLAHQIRAKGKMKLIPGWADNAMGGRMLTVKYEPINPTPHTAIEIILGGTYTGPFFMYEVALAAAKEGRTVIAVDGPSGGYSDGVSQKVPTGEGHKDGFGFYEGKDVLSRRNDLLLEFWKLVDPKKPVKDFPDYVVHGYSFGPTQSFNWALASDYYHLPNCLGYVDHEGGWGIQESMYATMVNSMSQRDNRTSMDLHWSPEIVLAAVEEDVNTTDRNTVLKTALYLSVSDGLKTSANHMHDEKEFPLSVFPSVKLGKQTGKSVAVVLAVDDEVLDISKVFNIGRYLSEDDRVPIYLLGGDDKRFKTDPVLMAFVQALKENTPKFYKADWQQASPHAVGHITPFNKMAHCALNMAVAYVEKEAKAWREARPLNIPNELKNSPYYWSFHTIIQDDQPEALRGIEEHLTAVGLALAPLDQPSYRYPKSHEAGWFWPEKVYEGHLAKLAYYINRYFPDQINQPHFKEVMIAAVNALRAQNGEARYVEPAVPAPNHLQREYLKSLFNSFQKYIKDYEEKENREVPSFNIELYRDQFMGVLNQSQFANDSSLSQARRVFNEAILEAKSDERSAYRWSRWGMGAVTSVGVPIRYSWHPQLIIGGEIDYKIKPNVVSLVGVLALTRDFSAENLAGEFALEWAIPYLHGGPVVSVPITGEGPTTVGHRIGLWDPEKWLGGVSPVVSLKAGNLFYSDQCPDKFWNLCRFTTTLELGLIFY